MSYISQENLVYGRHLAEEVIWEQSTSIDDNEFGLNSDSHIFDDENVESMDEITAIQAILAACGKRVTEGEILSVYERMEDEQEQFNQEESD